MTNQDSNMELIEDTLINIMYLREIHLNLFEDYFSLYDNYLDHISRLIPSLADKVEDRRNRLVDLNDGLENIIKPIYSDVIEAIEKLRDIERTKS